MRGRTYVSILYTLIYRYLRKKTSILSKMFIEILRDHSRLSVVEKWAIVGNDKKIKVDTDHFIVELGIKMQIDPKRAGNSRKNISDLQVCQAFEISRLSGDRFADEILMDITGEPEKVCLRAMERSNSRGLIEYGVSLRSGWLTEKGKQELGEMNEIMETKK